MPGIVFILLMKIAKVLIEETQNYCVPSSVTETRGKAIKMTSWFTSSMGFNQPVTTKSQ